MGVYDFFEDLSYTWVKSGFPAAQRLSSTPCSAEKCERERVVFPMQQLVRLLLFTDKVLYTGGTGLDDQT